MEGPPPAQQQRPTGSEAAMHPRPKAVDERHVGSGKLHNKVALITGGDSGIGRAVAVAFAREGADVAICYLMHDEDAKETCALVAAEGRRAIAIAGDASDEAFAPAAVRQTLDALGKLDVLVNNVGIQTLRDSITDISGEQTHETFKTNVFSMFYMTKAALPHLERGGSIINTTSVTAYKGNPMLLDYSASKGAQVAFTYSLAQSPEVLEKNIRVNAVAPGPIWTPLIPSTFPKEKVAQFGLEVPMKRPGQPEEVASCYVFLASNVDSSYMCGQVLHPNGGSPIHG